LIFLFGRELSRAFASPALTSKVEPIFGARVGDISWIQKDVYFNGKPRRRLRFGFQQYERLTVVVLPHATGAQGVASDYIEAFKPEMTKIIGDWWTKHEETDNSFNRDALKRARESGRHHRAALNTLSLAHHSLNHGLVTTP
jgi:hypothetical protein